MLHGDSLSEREESMERGTQLDRHTAPVLERMQPRPMQPARKETLDNGLPVYFVETGTQEVVRIELLFRAGSWYQDQLLVASATSSMMAEGTKNLSGHEIAEQFDFYGAYLQTDLDKDMASVTLYVMNRHVEDSLPLLEEVVKGPVFPEKSFQTHMQQARQSFAVNQQKVGFLARNAFRENLFGANHPYGYVAQAENFDQISQADVQQFHQTYYGSDRCMMVISGRPSDQLLTWLNKHFGGPDWKSAGNEASRSFKIETPSNHKVHIQHPRALQSAIRIGKQSIPRSHADYPGLRVLNTVLGGYFGSRLMTNIREDKGYTYGIYSQLVNQRHASYWTIGTEVGKAVTQAAIGEIYAEIDRLRKEPVPAEELQLVTNYLTGQFLRSHDGPFSLADNLKSILLHDLDYSYFQRYLDTLASINSEQIQALACNYFSDEGLLEVVAGDAEEKDSND